MHLLAEPHIQIAVLTENSVPIVTPLLDEQIKCVQLVLLAPLNTQKQLPSIERFLSGKGIAVSIIHLESDLNCIEEHLAHYSSPDTSVAINLTEGRKGLCCQLLLWAQRHGKPTFWLNTHTDRLRFVLPVDHPPLEIEDQLNIPDFLALKGMQVSQARRSLPGPPCLSELALYWAQQNDRRLLAFRALNRLASHACSSQITPQITSREANTPWFQETINDVLKRGLAQKQPDGRIKFVDHDVRSFCQGIWLEYACFEYMMQLKENRTDVQDVAHSVIISRVQRGQHIKNEFDVMAIINNRLFVIECKTGSNMSTDARQLALYRLDSISGMLGNNCHGFLVSLRNLGSTINGRAAEVGLRMVHSKKIPSLAQSVSRIANGKVTG
ncbi:Card1-like endonuclease domain-containing protein [Vibrio sp. FJH11]